MRAKEFINEVEPIQIQQGPDILPSLRSYHQDTMRNTFGNADEKRDFGAQDIVGGGQIRQMRAVQNTAPSSMFPKGGATGSTTSPLAHDTTPVIPINIKRVTNFEPPQKAQSNAITVNSMANKLAAGKELPPIAVRSTPQGYEVVDGHHRLAAHQQAGSQSIPAKVVEPENIRRINKPGADWGYDKSTKDFLKPGFDPNPKKISYDKYMKDLAKQTKK